MPITTLDYDPTDPRLQVQYTRQELAALAGKDLSTIKKWIGVHTIVEEQLPGDGRGTKVIRLVELVSRGLFHLDALPAEPGSKPESLQDMTARRMVERDNNELRKALATARAEHAAVEILLRDKHTEITKLTSWIDALLAKVGI